MAIILPFPLTVQEMRVLQEFRRVAGESLTPEAVKAIKHPVGGGEPPAQSLVSKGFLVLEAGNYVLTEKAKEFLAIDAKPMFEASGDSGDEAAE